MAIDYLTTTAVSVWVRSLLFLLLVSPLSSVSTRPARRRTRPVHTVTESTRARVLPPTGSILGLSLLRSPEGGSPSSLLALRPSYDSRRRALRSSRTGPAPPARAISSDDFDRPTSVGPVEDRRPHSHTECACGVGVTILIRRHSVESPYALACQSPGPRACRCRVYPCVIRSSLQCITV